MGGPGSGRSGGILTDKCEDYRSVDLAWLRRKGIFDSWIWATITWSRGGEVRSSIQVKREDYGVRFRYRARNRGDEWDDVNELMPFACTRTNFGGRRRWFECLSCGRICRVLCGGKYYRCRTCWGLRYESQYEPAWARPISPPSKVTAALFDMFCGLNGRTASPRRVNSRASPVTKVDLPTWEAVPWIMRAIAVMERLTPPCDVVEGG